MKIVRKSYVYVQLEDLNYLIGKENVPTGIMKVFCVTDEVSKFHFKKIDDYAAMEFIKKADCIPDYDELKSMSKDELIEMKDNLDKDKEHFAKKGEEAKTAKETIAYYRKAADCAYKRYQIENFMLLKDGLIEDIVFPEDVEPPKVSAIKKAKMKFLKLKNLLTGNNNAV